MRTLWAVGIAVSAVLVGACSSTESESNTGGSAGTTTTSSSAGGGGSGLTGGGGSGLTGGGGSGLTGGGGNAGTGGGGGAGGAAPIACQWVLNADPCPPGSYCFTANCGAGFCTPLEAVEQSDETPMCGCDGVSYWNASIAAVRGMPVRSAGACPPEQQETCGGIVVNPCPDPQHQVCDAHREALINCGGADMPGDCWAMPTQCPGIMFTTERTCQSPNGACIDRCQAIKSELPYFHDQTCPT